MIDGIVLIDKPPGPTSHDVVVQLRRHLGQKRVGHAGTLDPIASGLLVCLVGRATRFAQFIIAHRKRYTAVAVFGQMRDTYDRTGSIIDECDAVVSCEQLTDAVGGFRGSYQQVPPKFSAKKVGGQPAYKIARAGSTPQLQAQTVEIHELSIVSFEFPRVELLAEVSGGTYIRSLVVDLAERLGTCAYLAELRRTGCGPFSVESAVELDRLLNTPRHQLAEKILPIDAGLVEFPRMELDDRQEWSFVNGQFIDCCGADGMVRVYGHKRFVGVGRIEGGLLKPVRVIVK